MKLRQIVAAGAAALCLIAGLTGCSGGNADTITVLSREDGSGTRGAFIELFGIEQKDANGNKVDKTIATAEITNSTAVMMTTIAGNKNAIGYISLASLNDTVKALKVDGAEATAANVKSGDYKIARPFNVAVKAGLSEAAQDFLNFILSADGQAVVEESGCISNGNTGAYSGTKPVGTVTVAGSSSVTPLMEKLKEAYQKVNPNATVTVQQSDSTQGISDVAEGLCDIGMASRALKDSELSKGLTPAVIAMDGIAVIVNKENAVEDIRAEVVQKIYTGEITAWSELNA